MSTYSFSVSYYYLLYIPDLEFPQDLSYSNWSIMLKNWINNLIPGPLLFQMNLVAFYDYKGIGCPFVDPGSKVLGAAKISHSNINLALDVA